MATTNTNTDCKGEMAESPHRRGLHIDIIQMNFLLQKYLPSKGICMKLEEISKGFNNKSYIFTTEQGKEYVIRITKASWPKEKVECEVVALKFVRENTSIPVPYVMWYDSEGVDMGFRWIIMEKMPGENLSDIWDTLTEEHQKGIIAQAVDFLAHLQKIEWDKIGGFYMSNPKANIKDKENIKIGIFFEHMEGPFESSSEWTRWQLDRAINNLETCEKLVQLQSYLPKARKLARLLEEKDSPLGLSQVPIVTIHGDFAFYNMLVDRSCSPPIITALVDWEWAGAMPAHLEWDESSFGNTSIAHHVWFQEQAERCGLLCPTSIQDYQKHMNLIKIWRHLSPWQIGLFDERRDQEVIEEVKLELDGLFSLFNL